MGGGMGSALGDAPRRAGAGPPRPLTVAQPWHHPPKEPTPPEPYFTVTQRASGSAPVATPAASATIKPSGANHGHLGVRPLQGGHRPLEFPHRGADAGRPPLRAQTAAREIGRAHV